MNNDNKKQDDEENATDYRPHWEGSPTQRWRTLVFVGVFIVALFVFIVYQYGGVSIEPMPPA